MATTLHQFLHRFAKDDSGVAAVEFAIVSVPLILLILMTLECGIIFHIASLATEAANEAARVGKTGNLYGSTGTREALIKEKVEKKMAAWIKNPGDVQVTHESYGSFSDLGNTGTTGAGTGGQIVLYTISTHWTLFSPPLIAILGKRLAIKGTALVKNEAF